MKTTPTLPKKYFLTILLLLGLTGCMPPSIPAPDNEQTPFFVPPVIVTTSPTVMIAPSSEVSQQQTPTLDCQNLLSFMDDLTVPDGTIFEAGAAIDKQWEVENSGTCNWDERYTVRLTGGPDLGAEQIQALFPARSGSKATIQILFEAPQEAGTYRSSWQAFSPEGEPFGDPFYIEIIVE